MRFRAASLMLALVVLVAAIPQALAQEPPTKTPAQIFKEARDLISNGNYELASERLSQFLAADTNEPKYYLEIESKFGPTTFLRLRNVLKWSDNKAENAKSVALVETLIRKHQEASRKTFGDPIRIADLVRRLGSFKEERLYAEGQLKLAGVAAFPEMLKAFRSTNKPELQAAIVGLLPKMPAETMPALIASLEGLNDAERVLVLGAIMQREDVLNLPKSPESDYLPYLWYYASSAPEVKSSLRDTAVATLDRLYGPTAAKTKAEAALTALALPIASGKATYRTQDLAEASTGLIRVWTYDTTTLQVKPVDVSRSAADEYYALRYLRWALERNPSYGPAQRLFISFATERAVERAKFGDLTKTEPAVYQILAAAPATLLTDLLETALSEKRTALALGMLQALGDRAYKDSATAPPSSASSDQHPSPLVRALSYEDPRVQFAAAVALVRQPGTPTHGRSARVVEILRQALGADSDGSGLGTRGRALIADTNPVRGEGLAQLFREAGYAAERFATGRQLVTRLSKASDFDLIVIDRHLSDPILTDTLTQVTSDTNAVRRPVFVVASSDKPRTLPLELLLLRLSNLVAATDDGVIQSATGYEGSKPLQIIIPPPYAYDPAKPDKDIARAKQEVIYTRDRGMIGASDADKLLAAQKSDRPQPPETSLLRHRLARLKRLVDAADLPTNQDLADRLALRLPQLVVAGLVAEFEATPETAPRTVELLAQSTRNLLARRELAADAAEIPDLGNLIRLMDQLESKLSQEQKDKLRRIQIRTNPSVLALPADTIRDTELEAKLAAQVKRMPSVHILPDPFAAEYLRSDIEQAIQEPAQRPRDPAERLESAKVSAELLRRMAIGEIAGYDIRPAELELRRSLRVDATAEFAIDAVARIGSKNSQEDLVTLALTGSRPMALRIKAADAAIRHIQAFGRFVQGALAGQLVQVAPTEADLALRGKLGVLSQLLMGKAGDFGGVLQKFPVRLAPAEPAPKPPVPAPKPPEEPKM